MAQLKKAVLDTSVIIAGLLSSSGGSAKIIEACKNGTLQCAVSSSTKDEIGRNAEKLGSLVVEKFNALAASLHTIYPTAELVDAFTEFTDPDDTHLLASCKTWNAEYLISLNRKHLLKNQKAQTATHARIVSAGDLIQSVSL